MGISSTETNLGLKKILEEKGITYSSGNTTNLSLRGLSTDGSGNDAADYFDEASSQYVNVDGTPNSTAPYGIGEFRGYSHISFTFNMRGSNSSEPLINKTIKATSSVNDDSPAQSARTDVYYYVYYRTNGNLAITASSAFFANQTSGLDSFRRWVTQGGTSNTLTGTSQMPEPGIEIENIESGYTVRFEMDRNSSGNQLGIGSIAGEVRPTSLGTMSLSGDTFSHSGTASIPTQTSAQNTAGTFPTSTYIHADVDASTEPAIFVYTSRAGYQPAFRFIFEKSGSPTITIYCKASMVANADNVF